MEMSTAPPNPEVPPSVREKTELPGLVLLIVGLFNLLLSLWLVFAAIQSYRLTDEEMQQRLEITRRLPALRKVLEQDQGAAAKDVRKQSTLISTVWALLSVWAALVVILAGLRLRALRSYGVVLMGALLACVPFISCAGCCCLGQIAGMWAFLVLLNPEVRLAFRE
jgi:hypothetical protein